MSVWGTEDDYDGLTLVMFPNRSCPVMESESIRTECSIRCI